MVRKESTQTGFEYGAKVLKISVDALVDIYKTTISILHEGVSIGKGSPAIGLQSLMGYYDLLHGGAYTAPINALPHFAVDKTKSPYWAGDLANLIPITWLSWLAAGTAGESAMDMMNEVFEDANVPHVFPKLLSDPMYAQLKLAFAQAMSMDFFKSGTSSISTLVEGVGEGVGAVTPLLALLRKKG